MKRNIQVGSQAPDQTAPVVENLSKGYYYFFRNKLLCIHFSPFALWHSQGQHVSGWVIDKHSVIVCPENIKNCRLQK